MFTRLMFIPLFIFCTTIRLCAQNMPYYDSQLLHFGFSLGTNLMHFNVSPSFEPQSDGMIYDVRTSELIPGFTVGGIVDLRLHKNLNLRCTPNLSFGQYSLSYKETGSVDTDKLFYEVKSLPVSIPFLLKFSADRVGNYRPYIIGGGGMRFDVGRNKDEKILLQSTDYFVEFGFGCDTYFAFFKWAPELKFAIGFNDMLVPMEQRPYFEINDDKKYTQAIDRLLSRMLTLTFHFE